MRHINAILLIALVSMSSCNNSETGAPIRNAYVRTIFASGVELSLGGKGITGGIAVDAAFEIRFSAAADAGKYNRESAYLVGNEGKVFFSARQGRDASSVILSLPSGSLDAYSEYSFFLKSGENFGLRLIDEYTARFLTGLDNTPKFPEISDEELLTLVQEKTFGYFWKYAHPLSGLARERSGSGDTVTSGGSGFGLMTIPVAVERGFITRSEALERLTVIVSFLSEKADRFHGAFPHWLNGSTGKAIAFSQKDNGADLVETAFLMQGLLTVKHYFNGQSQAEVSLRSSIDKLWSEVEWDWFRNGRDVLYWHWSPNYEWAMNMPISGWNEALIVYVLAASSPTHAIGKSVYDNGWARGGAMKNGKKFYDIQLPLGSDFGGPLFFSHYSFLGLDPRSLKDAYADYWAQNTAHAQINHRYCKANPAKWYGYASNCWGLTASDYYDGYTASSPTNDHGTIAPTAALSSFPYTPEESMAALKYFYYILGDKLWGEYGFKDSFCLDRRYFAPSYLAIDQGPVVIMIENYRTGLLWNLFMRDEDVRRGLEVLGFSY